MIGKVTAAGVQRMLNAWADEKAPATVPALAAQLQVSRTYIRLLIQKAREAGDKRATRRPKTGRPLTGKAERALAMREQKPPLPYAVIGERLGLSPDSARVMVLRARRRRRANAAS